MSKGLVFRDQFGRIIRDGSTIIFLTTPKHGLIRKCTVFANRDGSIMYGFERDRATHELVHNRFYWENDGRRCYLTFAL